MTIASAELARIKADLEKGLPSPSVTVREFLGWFGAQRRGYWIVQQIRDALAHAALETQPDFEGAYIDSEITLRGKRGTQGEAAITLEPVTLVATAAVDAPPMESSPPTVGGDTADPTYRIGKLEAANREPKSVLPNDALRDAVTLMMMDDLAVLPVMQGIRSLRGAVTWRSIGERLALGHTQGAAQDFMEQPEKVDADRSLFATIPTIVEKGYVFVMEHGAVKGLVTSRDLSIQFKTLSEPFLLLSEIENQVRRLIAAKFTQDELQDVRDPTDASRVVHVVADLTFGEYVRLLEKPERWNKLALALDRALFVKRLEEVRRIRNDVMHFDPDGVAESELDKLRDFARFLRQVTAIAPGARQRA
jgi:CBS domain-containing protein